MVEMPTSDVWTLLLSTVRYAMGRQTYIVGEACDLVRKYACALASCQVKQIADEVSAELRIQERCGRTLGASFDHSEWARLVDTLRESTRGKGEP